MTSHQATTAQSQYAGRAVSGAITTTTSRSGTTVAILRANYGLPSLHGGWTVHGYARRCPSCRRISFGGQFATVVAAAREHECEAPRV